MHANRYYPAGPPSESRAATHTLALRVTALSAIVLTLLVTLLSREDQTLSASPPHRAAIWGNIVDTRGGALADAQVLVDGVSMAGENLELTASTDADGRYSFSMVPAGRYRVRAYIDRAYDGRNDWHLPLHPTDDSEEEMDVDPSISINKDFRWQLTGQLPRPRQGYHGATLNISLGISDRLPNESYVRFTLTPTGPLIDGSEGRELVLEATIAQWMEGGKSGIVDIPLATYNVTCFIRLPDQRVFQLLLMNNSTGLRTQPVASVQFRPGIPGRNWSHLNGIEVGDGLLVSDH